MRDVVHEAHQRSSGNCAWRALAWAGASVHNLHMRNRVAKLRDAKGWSQQELADRAGVSRTQVTRLEAGTLNPTLKTLSAVARALSVDVGALFLSDQDDPEFKELFSVWRSLSADHRRVAHLMLQGLRPPKPSED